jgi:hypothetical protein
MANGDRPRSSRSGAETSSMRQTRSHRNASTGRSTASTPTSTMRSGHRRRRPTANAIPSTSTGNSGISMRASASGSLAVPNGVPFQPETMWPYTHHPFETATSRPLDSCPVYPWRPPPHSSSLRRPIICRSPEGGLDPGQPAIIAKD